MKFKKDTVSVAHIGLSVSLLIALVAVGYLAHDRSLLYDDWSRWQKRATAFQGLAGFEDVVPIHVHADWRLYIDGEPVDLLHEEFYETNPITHVHGPEDGDENEWVIHVHNKGVTLRHFLTGMGMEPSSNCLTVESTRYCTEDDRSLKYYVNGEISADGPDYEIQDLDRILVTFGDDDAQTIQSQIDSVGSKACVQSAKC